MNFHGKECDVKNIMTKKEGLDFIDEDYIDGQCLKKKSEFALFLINGHQSHMYYCDPDGILAYEYADDSCQEIHGMWRMWN